MQTKNWGELLKLQDQYSKEEDLKLKKKHQLYKQLYKKQLQQIIMEQKSKKISDKDLEKQLIDYQVKKQQVAKNLMQAIQQQQKKNRQRWQQVRETFSKQNYQSSFERRMSQKQVLQQEKRKYSETFKKISTQVSQEKQREKRMYSQKKVDLAKAYDQQLHYEERIKHSTKSQQQRIFQLGKRLEQEKQRERSNALNRVRFGYAQNKKVYDLSSQIMQRKSRQRIDFIQKMASPSQIIQNQDPKYNYLDKQKKLKQVSSYNRYAFENKHLRKRLQTLEEKDFEHRKLEYLNQQIQQEQQQQKVRKEKQKRQLQLQLQRQIAQFQEGRMRSKHLNPEQAKINKSLYRSQNSHERTMLPGVAHDYSAQRHQRIIENFLRGDRKYTLE